MNFTREFLSEIPFSGCKEIVQKGRPSLDRFLWLICVLGSLIFSIVLVSEAWTSYQENPTTTIVSKEDNGVCAVPAITICFTKFTFKKIKATRFVTITWGPMKPKRMRYYIYFIYKIANYSYKYLDPFSRYLLDPTLPRTSGFGTLQKKFRFSNHINHFDYSSKHVFEPKNKSQMVSGEVGFCECFNCMYGNRWHLANDVSVTIDGRVVQECSRGDNQVWHAYYPIFGGTQIYIHSPNDFPVASKPDIVSTDNLFRTNFLRVNQIVSRDMLASLTISQRKCRLPSENNLTVTPWYRRSACYMQCRRDMAEQLCGCVPHVYKQKDDVRMCEVDDFYCLIFHKRKLMMDFYKNCYCEPDCGRADFVNIDPNIKFQEFKNAHQFHYQLIRINSNLFYFNDVTYTKLDMLASWGSTVSFFLGGTIMSLIEMTYLLLRWPLFTFIGFCKHQATDFFCHKKNKITVMKKLFQYSCKTSSITRTCHITVPHCQCKHGMMHLIVQIFAHIKSKILAAVSVTKKLWFILLDSTLALTVKEVFTEWASNASVQGVKYVVRNNISVIGRVLWFATFMTLIILSGIVAFEIMQSNSILVYEESISQMPLQFSLPAVFVKPLFPYINETKERLYDKEDKSDEAMCFLTLMYPDRNGFIDSGCDKHLNNELQWKFFEKHRNCTLNFHTCELNGKKFPCCSVFKLFMTEVGPFFAMNSPQQPDSSDSIKKYLEEAQLLQKHQKYTFRYVFSNQQIKTASFAVLPKAFNIPSYCDGMLYSFAKYKNRVYYMLRVTETSVDQSVLAESAEYRGCRMPWETIPGSKYPVYSLSTCLSECRVKIMKRLCGCAHLFSSIYGILLSTRSADMCGCLKNCQDTYFETVRFGWYGNGRTEMTVQYFSSSRKIRLLLMRGTLETFVLVGGVISLFLGPSVLSVVEFIFFFTVHFVRYGMKKLRHQVF